MKKRSDLFKINLIYFILLCAFVLVRIVFALNLFNLSGTVSDIVGSLLIQIGIMFGLTFVLYLLFFKKKPKDVFKDYKFTKINFKAVLISIAIGIITYFLTLCVAAIFNFFLGLFGYQASSGSSAGVGTWGDFLVSIVLVAILPGFCEEFVHRGLLVKGFSELGVKKTIIYSGLLFGLMHLNISQFFYATLIGCLLVLLVMASGSIIPAMIVHFMNNLINVYFSYAEDLNLPLRKTVNALGGLLTGYGILSILLLIVLIAVALFGLVFLIKALFKETYGRRFEKVKSDIAKEYLRDQVLGQIESPEVGSPDAGLVFDEEVDIAGDKRLIKIKIPFERMGLDAKPIYKPKFVDNIFFYASLALGITITIFTFIWGLVI